MKLSFKKSYLASLLFPIAFIGCGGGGGSSTSSVIPTSTTYSVSGTVPGTIIEAYCTDGSFYTTNSISNETNEHPFTLNIPQNSECRFVMITNEKDTNGNPTPYTDWIITPISINGSSYLELDKNISFGYVPLSRDTNDIGVRTTPLLITVSDIKVSSLLNDPLDIDKDGIPNVYEDDDNDGIYNKEDDDDDNDGTKDIDEISDDHDGDGIKDIYDRDDDNDGYKDEDDDDDKEDDNYNYTTSITLPTSFVSSEARLLASQCAQCHGTNGVSSNSWDSIKNEDDIITQERFDDADELIMQHQANGYTYEEALAIRNWLNSL